MSLTREFPEIVTFFNQDRFSQAELDFLIQEIEKNYPDKSILNAANTLIKLEILKFELQKVSKSKKILFRNQNIEAKPHKVPTPTPTSIILLSEKLGWRPRHLLRILEQKNIYKKENDTLSTDELSSINEIIKNRLKGISRKQKIESRLKKFSGFRKKVIPGTAQDDSVYGKLALYGPGKLIYIRSR